MPLSASIDIGSNTIRLLIGKTKDNSIIEVFSGRKITRLADGINQTGILKDENIEASITVLKEFSSIVSRYRVKYVRAVATSALREAYNSDTFIKRVSADTGISIEVISGEKEAELILKGILSSLPDSSPIAHQPTLVIDIGGGSTEWILCKDRHPVDMGSIPTGVIKLARSFIKTDPVSDTDIEELNRKIISFLEEFKIRIVQHIDRCTFFVGTAGTFTTIASIDLKLDTYSREKIHLYIIPLSRLRDISGRLLALSLKERKNIKGLEPERADLIIPGIQFTIKIMEYFEFDELIVSDYGLLEGALLEIPREGWKKYSRDR